MNYWKKEQALPVRTASTGERTDRGLYCTDTAEPAALHWSEARGRRSGEQAIGHTQTAVERPPLDLGEESEMQKWEYKIINIRSENYRLDPAAAVEMNRLGDKGWELISITSVNFKTGATDNIAMTFKRPVG